MPSTRNVSRTSANLNGIHNARFAGLPLADTDGRGRGAARAAVKNPRRAVHPPAGGGTRRLGRNFSPAGIQCRDAGRGANGAVSVGTGLARRRRAAASTSPSKRTWSKSACGPFPSSISSRPKSTATTSRAARRRFRPTWKKNYWPTAHTDCRAMIMADMTTMDKRI